MPFLCLWNSLFSFYFSCLSCSAIAYCSDKCRANAWESYHLWDCLGANNAFWRHVGIGHLATRLLFVGLPKLNKVLHSLDEKSVHYNNVETILLKIDQMQKKTDCRKFLINAGERYAFVLSLITNMEHIKKDDFTKYFLVCQ